MEVSVTHIKMNYYLPYETRIPAAPAAVLHAANTTTTTSSTMVTKRPGMVTPTVTQHPVTTAQHAVTTKQHPVTLQHTVQQRLPQLLQMHKTRIPLPSTTIPITARIRQAPRRIPAPPPSVKEQKTPKKVTKRLCYNYLFTPSSVTKAN